MNRPNDEAKRWLISLLLAAPAFIPLVAHYIGFSRIGLWPTGFIQNDMPYYMANARELSDSGGFHLAYGNPFSFRYETPRIYFQPLTVLFGLLERATGADPGILFAAVGVIGATVCVRLAMSLFDRFAPHDQPGRSFALVAFIWGGGLLMVGGLIFSLLHGVHAQAMLFYDPAQGWWFMNLGRNLVFSTEAVYHAIFFGAILLVLGMRYKGALAALALMSVSHPFTGIQLLLIVIAWSLVELLLIRSKAVPLWFAVACIGLAIAHAAYYLMYLNSFAEHRILQEQWTLPLVLPLESFVLASIPVLAFVVWRMRSRERARAIFSLPQNRLLVVWFGVTLILINHDLVMRPVQPVHFTRGYQWIPLFLLAAPAMMAMFARLGALRRRGIAMLATVAALGIIVSDNAIWLGIRGAQALGLASNHFSQAFEFGSTFTPRARSALGFGLTREELEVLRVMNDSANRGFVVVSADPILGYLATVYTPLRSWRSHHANTPQSERRDEELHRFFNGERAVAEWDRLPVLFVFLQKQPWRERMSLLRGNEPAVVLQNPAYVVIRRPPLEEARNNRASSVLLQASIRIAFDPSGRGRLTP